MNEYKEKDRIVLGIDLGTSNSCVSVWRNNNLEIITDENYNEKTIPSVVAFSNRTKYIGTEAKNQKDMNPKNVIYEIKRLMGKKKEDILDDLEFITYDIDEDDSGNILVSPDINKKKKYTPEEISAMILIKLRQNATKYLGYEINEAIVSVPAYFNDSQKQATLDACEIAGINCLRIINEPTAAALAYGLMNMTMNIDKELTVIVYDLGGGTLDVSILTIINGLFEVKASVGNTRLGGSDFDVRMMSYCLNAFKTKYGYDTNNILHLLSPLSLQKLRTSCEKAKMNLSINLETIIYVNNFYDNHDLFIKVTRNMFNDICRDLFMLCLKSVDDALKSANLLKTNIDKVILVGGMTRVIQIRDNIKNYFGGLEPDCSIDPDIAVSMGAAIQGYIISHKDDPFSNTLTLLDVVSLSFGIETIGGIMNVLVPRNSVIPITKKRKYTTDDDYMTSVKIKIFEGERSMTKDNFFVGEFELSNLESMPRGHVKIEVKFNIDVNGIIRITAEDLDNTNNVSGLTITGNKGRLNSQQIKDLVSEAKEEELMDIIEKKKKLMYYISSSCTERETKRLQKYIDRGYSLIKCPFEEMSKFRVDLL